MKLKAKLSLGLWFLFLVSSLLGGLGLYFLRELAQDSQDILKANYESLSYVEQMTSFIDSREDRSRVTDMQEFETALRKQEQNVTEVGERNLTHQLRLGYTQWQRDTSQFFPLKSLREPLHRISELNRQAIFRKSQTARQTADTALLLLSCIATFCLLVTFSFAINFPSFIANPIRELTGKIKEVAARNYATRLGFRSDDEFGELAAAFNTMAQKLDQWENSNLAKIQFEKRRVETVIASMPEAIIGLDEKRTILFVNPLGLSLLGMKESDLVGKYAPDVAVRNDLLRTLLQGDRDELKIVMEGQEGYFSRETQPVKNGDTQIGEVIVLRNVTRFHDLDQAKTNFIATVSHELKTPISAIKMSLQLLTDKRVGDLNEDQQQLVSSIQSDAQRLLRITGELLELSQVETGNIQLQIAPVSAETILSLAQESVRSTADQRHVQLAVQVPPTPLSVLADPEKTAWVLINFLTNAIRYSPEQGTVQIIIRQVDQWAEFSVRDQGRGIEASYLNKIFERYFQIPNGQGKTGTGLGLAIAKDFIEAQGGNIWAQSEGLGYGSLFAFRLPLHT
ncbi:PAS domain-containing sensor histidine kinase [Siphonobacter sp. BAB-5385]|uniref:sensor histidine kinase n=1 Tax=unclassified Siphonobacter TaxID=2635712 RepID=UPI000B9DF15A|nr:MULTISPECIES: ATP-binding protein [unclassified Siphonobacter]OZI07106.1 PAS domain-containing sensor histidine kinase [Siphonobacter sp. BAB-5385]PMD97165.1 PAS domain-containing sensor histidine kinase [Siphonobacter sp. BAB-5405]